MTFNGRLKIDVEDFNEPAVVNGRCVSEGEVWLNNTVLWFYPAEPNTGWPEEWDKWINRQFVSLWKPMFVIGDKSLTLEEARLRASQYRETDVQ